MLRVSAGGAEFVDGPVVRAARSGGVLLLQNLHAAERNVLPAINNLLENRELVLEVGQASHACLAKTLASDEVKHVI